MLLVTIALASAYRKTPPVCFAPAEVLDKPRCGCYLEIRCRGNTNHKSRSFACSLLSMLLKTKETQNVNKINENMLFRNETVTI